MSFGFVESIENRIHLVDHCGALPSFGSSLNLLPEDNIGNFISLNAECFQTNTCKIVSDFRDLIIERFIVKE